MNAFASDIDGTLIFERKIKDCDKEAIQQFQKNNLFGVCSGRPRCALFDLKPLTLDFYILSSGAYILDKHLHVLFESIMHKQTIKNLFTTYQSQCEIIVQTGNPDCFYATFYEDNNPHMHVIRCFEDVEHENFYSLSLLFDNEEKCLKALKELQEQYTDIVAYKNRLSLDIVNSDCSKGTGIRFIQNYYHIDLMAGIGDSYNDIPLLQASDISFTFHQSPKEVQDNANFIVNNIKEAIEIMEDKLYER